MLRSVLACFATWSLLTTLFTLGSAYAQSRLDLSGTWELDAGYKAEPDAPPPPQRTLIITQTVNEVSIETRFHAESAREVLTFKLDGSEHQVNERSGAPIITKCRWDGAKLVTETTRSVRGMAVKNIHVFSLDSSGRQLTVDKTLIVQHGYRSHTPRNTGTGKEVYVRATPAVTR